MQPVTYSKLAETVYTINNANRPWGTLIEEIPTDVGRSWAGYKRGGILEGAEKMRKELMTAAVWMAGIPAFNKLGDFFCEHVLKIPMKIEYSNSKEGNKAIEDSIHFLKTGENPRGLDVSEISHYQKTLKDKLKITSFDKLVNQVKYAKQITSISAVILNCLAIGIVLPKINQAITQKKLDEMEANKADDTNKLQNVDKTSETNTVDKTNISNKDTTLKVPNINEFIASINSKNEQKAAEVSFTGLADKVTYLTNNSNTFRLVVTDIPMILGRMVTSRNKYEALEYLVMDGTSIFFYNFCANLVQKGLRKLTHVPDVNPKVAEIIAQADKTELQNAFNLVQQGEKQLHNIFTKDTADLIYKEATYGKYGKINTFIKHNDLKAIDESVVSVLGYFKDKSKDLGQELYKDGSIDTEALKKLAKKVTGDINKANALYLGSGLLLSIIGLAVIIPKLTFAITKYLTGKDQFTGIAHYDDDKKNVKKN